MKNLRVLIVEDVEDDLKLLLLHLSRAGYEVDSNWVQTADELRAALEEREWDIVISDYRLPNFTGLDAFRILQKSGRDIPFIIISGTIGEETAVAAMRAGVSDYLMKDSLARLVPAIERELADPAARRARREAEERYRIVAETASDAIITIDASSRIIFANPASQRVFGYGIDELIGKNVTMLMPEPIRDDHLRGIAEFIRTGIRSVDWSGWEITGLRKDGTEIPIGISYGEYRNRSQIFFTAIIRDITAAKQAEREIRESGEDFRALVEATTEYVWEFDEKGAVTEFPHWWVELTGQNFDDARDFGWLENVHPEDRRKVKTAFLRALETRTQETITVRIADGNGEYGHYATRAVPLLRDDGSFRKWICTLTDISEIIQSREALERSEIHLRTIIDSSPECIRLTDAEGGLLEMNPTGLEMVEADTFEQVAGMKAIDLIKPKYHDAYFDLTKRVFNGESARLEYEIVGLRGGEHWVEMNAVPLRDICGKIIAALSVTSDVTGRHQMEEALRKKAAELRLITDTVPMLIAYADTEQRYSFANKAFLEWVGKQCDEVSGRTIAEVIGEASYERVRSEVEEALAGRASTYERIAYREKASHQGGNPSFVKVSYVPDFDSNGNVLGFFTFILDLTETKMAEEALRESQEQLAQSQKLESIGRLAGGIAHDFNNMLTAINGYSELALRKIALDDPIRRNIEEIKKAGERSAELTNQLLAFSRRQMLQPRVLDINHAISETFVMLKRLIGEDIDLSMKLDSDVGRVSADPGQFAQVLVNLAVNSRDAMPDGGSIVIETKNVELDEGYASNHVAVNPGRYVMIAVSDNGVGMDEQTRNHIFEPFFTTKEVGKGTGLGLSTVYGIVKQSGGNIWVYSEPGRGTTFKIYLPLVTDEATASAAKPMSATFRFGSETILLVEDEAVVRNLSREVLESCGYRVIEAVDGIEALKIAENLDHGIDLLMTDVVMPQIGGRELAEKLSERFPKMHVLFTSGYTDSAAIRHGILNEGTNFLPKPFTFNELADIVRELLDRPRK